MLRRLESDWNWCLFDEDLEGQEIDFPALGWRRVWIEKRASGVTVEIREWHFGCDHPDGATSPAPAWRVRSILSVDPA